MRAPRLFLDEKLAPASSILLTQERAHYLRNVMRLRPGDSVKLFNGLDGEWLARVERIERRNLTLEVTEQVKPQTVEKGTELYFAPLKRHRMELLIEKSVELGVKHLRPVVTAHTVVERLNPVRQRSRIIEASEQSARLTLPKLDEPIALEDLPKDQKILMADEHGGGMPMLQALDAFPESALLVGPEGGFSLEERESLRSLDCIQTVTLGNQILRAETAAIFMLSVWRAWSDDELVED